MPVSRYRQVTQLEDQNKIRKRYRSEIDRLEALGFEELCFYSEDLFAYGACALVGQSKTWTGRIVGHYKDGKEFQYGHRLGGPWWELKDQELPNQEALLEYLGEMETKIRETLESWNDEDLLAPFTLYDWSGKTLLGHHVYALRHTMHHQGGLTVLATQHGHENDNWK